MMLAGKLCHNLQARRKLSGSGAAEVVAGEASK